MGLLWFGLDDKILNLKQKQLEQKEQMQDLRNEVKQLSEKLDKNQKEMDNKLEDYQEDTNKELENLKQMIYESKPVTQDLSKKERQLLELFLDNEWVDKNKIAQHLDISANYSGVLVSRLREKIELETKEVDSNGKKAYKLPKEVRERIEQGV